MSILFYKMQNFAGEKQTSQKNVITKLNESRNECISKRTQIYKMNWMNIKIWIEDVMAGITIDKDMQKKLTIL